MAYEILEIPSLEPPLARESFFSFHWHRRKRDESRRGHLHSSPCYVVRTRQRAGSRSYFRTTCRVRPRGIEVNDHVIELSV